MREVIRDLVSGKLPWPLYLFGPAGTGKTSVALCVCDHVDRSLFITVERLASEWVDCVCGRLDLGAGKIGPTQYRQMIVNRPLVCVDDIGVREKISDTHYEIVKLVLDLRETKPLIVTSNQPLEVIMKLYDDRIADRLSAGTVIELTGESRRRSS